MLKIEALPPAAIGPLSIDRLGLIARYLTGTLPVLVGGVSVTTAATPIRPLGIAVPRLVRRTTTVRPARVIARRDATN